MTMLETERGSVYHEDSSSSPEDYEYETTSEQDFDSESPADLILQHEPFVHFRSLNNYLNNLNLATFNFNLNNRFNAFVADSSLWKLYENSTPFPLGVPLPKPPKIDAIANLWKQLGDTDGVNEAENVGKRLEFEKVRKQASEEVQRRLGPKINQKVESKRREDSIIIEQDDGVVGKRGRQYHRGVTSIKGDPAAVEEDPQLTLNQEFWSQFLGFKTDSEEGLLMSETPLVPTPPINPFYSRFYLSTYDKIKLCVMVPVCLVRLVLIIFFLALALCLMLIGTCGLSEQQFKEAPLSKWRRIIRWITAHVAMRTVYFIMGFYWVKQIGRMASAQEAPVIVAAPHSSFCDAFIVPLLGGPSVVARLESSKTPFFGKLMDFTQAIYVDRENPDSRNTCKTEIRRRVKSGEGWPQVFIFPEGTCTNRSALAQFKLGAFQPGVPIQPLIIRYPNRLDSFTWTFDGPSSPWSIFVTLTQLWNSIELEFLPVYKPSEEEQVNEIVFARNVQKLMAEALGIPATEFTFEDGIALGKLASSKVREKISKIWKIKGELNLREAATETTLVYEGTTTDYFDWRITYPQFQDMFHVTGEEDEASSKVRELFQLVQQKNPVDPEMIDMRPYLILTCLLYSDSKLTLLQTLVFKMYAGKRPEMTVQEYMALMQDLCESSEKDAIKLFQGGNNSKNKNSISFSEFQKKVGRYIEYLKLYAMEETGQCSGNFPRRSQRDRRPQLKPKDD